MTRFKGENIVIEHEPSDTRLLQKKRIPVCCRKSLTITECSFIIYPHRAFVSLAPPDARGSLNPKIFKGRGGDMRLKDEDKQRRIKEAMVSLILQEGIDGASVSKIAKEAGVSAATIYVYYDSKEAMLAEVFREYAHQPYAFIMERVRPKMDGGELIEALVRGCYAFSTEHEDIFSFVEQCSRCPTLAERVCEKDCSGDVMDMIHRYQDMGVMKRVSDWNMAAVLFAPVRWLAMNRRLIPADPDRYLDELIRMLQDMLLN